MPRPATLFRPRLLPWARRIVFERLTRAGRWFVWPSLAFVAFGALSARGQVFLPLSYALALWTVALAASFLSRPRVRARVRHADRVCAGGTLAVTAEVEGLGTRTQPDLHFRTGPLPPGIECRPEDGWALAPLEAGRPQTARIELACAARGAYTLPGFRVETDAPFGLWRTAVAAAPPRRLLVTPRFTSLTELALPSGRRYQPGGVALASLVGEACEYVGNREYRDGDSVRDIDWRATARLQRPIVREYREEYFLRVAVVLDTHVPRRAPRARREDFERAVSHAAAVGDALARQEYLVDLFAAGPNLYHLLAGRSLAYLDQILDILACVESTPEEPFATLEPELVANLASISCVVCVFLQWDEPRRAFADLLRRHGVGLMLDVVRSEPCLLEAELGATPDGPRRWMPAP
jgi:uncharacterized protein (DUF58 family)